MTARSGRLPCARPWRSRSAEPVGLGQLVERPRTGPPWQPRRSGSSHPAWSAARRPSAWRCVRTPASAGRCRRSPSRWPAASTAAGPGPTDCPATSTAVCGCCSAAHRAASRRPRADPRRWSTADRPAPPGRAVLGRNPSAPARRASSARLRSSVPDSARILVLGWRALMCRIAATPPSGGMVRSMIATSASQRATSSAASSTYVVWPPTVNSSPHSRVSSRARPCAKSSWSSTMTTTILLPPALAFIAAMLAATLWSAG